MSKSTSKVTTDQHRPSIEALAFVKIPTPAEVSAPTPTEVPAPALAKVPTAAPTEVISLEDDDQVATPAGAPKAEAWFCNLFY